MKKRSVVLLLIAAMTLSTAANTVITYAEESEGSSETKEEILARIDEVNVLDDLLEEYGSMTFNYEYTQDNMTDTIYLSDDNYIEISNDGYIMVRDEEDKIYGRDSEEEDAYFKMVCFSDQDIEAFETDYEQIQWYTSSILNDNAEIKEEDDTLIITLPQEMAEEDKESFAEMFDLDVDKIDNLEYRLEADPETKVINRIVYSLNCGSTGIMLADVHAEYGTDKPELPQELDDFLNETDVRKVTFVLDPGTEEETTYEDTIRKGCSYRLIGDDFTIYTDKECTTEYEGNADLTKDSTLYLVFNTEGEEE